MEILIHLSSTNIKRLFQFTEKKLSDYVGEVGKDYWIVRQPIRSDQFKWTFLLGTNTDVFDDYKAIDFFRVDSARGREILLKLNLTEPEQFDYYQDRLL